MTDSTYSASASDTISTPSPEPTGPPATSLSSEPTYDELKSLARLLGVSEAVVHTGRPSRDLWFLWWTFKAKVRHALGLHTFIDLEDWDREQGSIKLIGQVCWFCDAQR